MMTLLLAGWFLMLAAAIVTAVGGTWWPEYARLRQSVWIVGLAGVMLGLIGSSGILITGGTQSVYAAWNLPIGGVEIRIGQPEALLISMIHIVGGATLLAKPWGDDEPWDTVAFLILIPALGMCLAARDMILFLMAWEVMALAGLIMQRGRGLPEDQYDGHGLWAYLISAHIGTLFLLILLPLLVLAGGDQAAISQGKALLWDQPVTGLKGSSWIWAYVALTIAGFGTKAGVAPLHGWVKTVYRNAPAWFGGASSGMMAKVSLYLMIRTLVQLIHEMSNSQIAWLGTVLMLLGLLSALLGLGGALTSARIKVVLGYSSVENVGIILVGFGLGFWGVARDAWVVAAFGFAGAWFHMINHMLAKSLLFLATASVASATGTDDLARLGGLLKRMPVTGRAFGLGAMSLAAMIPLNAFCSELLIYNGLFLSVMSLGAVGRDLAILTVAAMGMVGGLAAVCFTGLWGLGFMGNARSHQSESCNEDHLGYRGKVVLNYGALALLALGILPVLGLNLAWLPASRLISMLGGDIEEGRKAFSAATELMSYMTLVGVLLVVISLGLKRWRDTRLAATSIHRGPTWDCGFGYTDNFARGQYSGLSYFEPLLPFVSKLTLVRIHRPAIIEPFPPESRVRVEAADGLVHRIYDPLFQRVGLWLGRLRWIQAGSIQLYLGLMAFTLIGMLIWLILL
ncbi:MAG: proton-conducting transporter membrane subunit [bacterium]